MKILFTLSVQNNFTLRHNLILRIFFHRGTHIMAKIQFHTEISDLQKVRHKLFSYFP